MLFSGFKILLCLYLSVITGNLNAKTNHWKNFSMSESAKPLDWKNFFEISPEQRKKLWESSAKGKLGSLHWSWRMAWTKSCSFSNEAYCLKLLKHSLLKDEVLVVRNEAVMRIGDRFENTQNADAIKLLELAYRDQRNTKSGAPLFIQRKIIDSILKVGGKIGLEKAGELAKTDKKMSEYWKKRSKI